MEGALNRLVAHATLVGTSISIETAQLVLQDLLKSSNKNYNWRNPKKVAEHFNIRLTDMHSPRRSRSVARPRQIAMYLAKSITSKIFTRDWKKIWWKRSHNSYACSQENRRIETFWRKL